MWVIFDIAERAMLSLGKDYHPNKALRFYKEGATSLWNGSCYVIRIGQDIVAYVQFVHP